MVVVVTWKHYSCKGPNLKIENC